MSVSKGKYFELSSYKADWEGKELSFSYKHVLQDETEHTFTEVLSLPKQYSPKNSQQLQRILASIHLVLGLSYYKAFVPDTIKHPYKLSNQAAHFWNMMYTLGLGEFYYVNKLPYMDRVLFEATEITDMQATQDHRDRKALVLHGGGKDSIVSAEVIKKSGIPFDLFTLGTSQIQDQVAEVMNAQVVSVERKLDEKLLTFNRDGIAFNGHVPVASMYSFVALLIAFLEGYSDVVISNEESSDYGNVMYEGHEINHQWDKSKDFEDRMRIYIEQWIQPGIEYYSLLRPLHELHVMKLFTFFPQYFEVFSSSNHNFALNDNQSSKRWDLSFSKGKIEFVFALAAAWLSMDDVMKIFEMNVFDEERALDRYRELLGLKDIKPLDCVGTPEETLAALYLAHKRGEFSGTRVMNMFEKELLGDIADPDNHVRFIMEFGNADNIPEDIRAILSQLVANQE